MLKTRVIALAFSISAAALLASTSTVMAHESPEFMPMPAGAGYETPLTCAPPQTPKSAKQVLTGLKPRNAAPAEIQPEPTIAPDPASRHWRIYCALDDQQRKAQVQTEQEMERRLRQVLRLGARA